MKNKHMVSRRIDGRDDMTPRRIPLLLAALAAAVIVTITSAFAQSTPMTDRPHTAIAKGTFVVKLAPLTVEGQGEGSPLGRMSIDKQISGDLVATTTGQMLSAMTATKGSAGYVAIERVEGTLHGRKGSFVLQHTGLMNRGTPSLSVVVVPDSGTGDLVGLSGTFDIIIANGVHGYEFRYSLP